MSRPATGSSAKSGGISDQYRRFSPSSPNPWDSVHVFSPTSTIASATATHAPPPPPPEDSFADPFPVATPSSDRDDPYLDHHDGDGGDDASEDDQRPRSSDAPQSASIWSLLQHRAPYYIPILTWGPSCTWKSLGADALAGLTVAFVLIPQSLSYASQLIFLEPMVGLYAAFVPLLVYALFGTSKHFAAGPEALTAILTGASVNMGETFEQRMADTILLTLLVGLFTLMMGIFRLGIFSCLDIYHSLI